MRIDHAIIRAEAIIRTEHGRNAQPQLIAAAGIMRAAGDMAHVIADREINAIGGFETNPIEIIDAIGEHLEALMASHSGRMAKQERLYCEARSVHACMRAAVILIGMGAPIG